MPSKHMNVVAVIFFASVMFLGRPAIAGWNTEKLYAPDPISVSQGMTIADTKALIKRSLLVLNWQIVETGPDEIEGRFFDKNESAEITVRFDARSIRLVYKDSKGLQYDKNSAEIHKTYNRWIQKLEKMIRGQITN